jgi:hypothetical protein
MMVAIAELLWPARRPKLEGIEDIAARIAAGNPPPAAEIVAVLDSARCSDADLQKAVDRHHRVAELRRVIADAAQVRKRFAVLDAELKAADSAVEKAVKAREVVVGKVGREHLALKLRVDEATRAEEAILDPANLPPAAALRLASASAVADAAVEAATAARASLANLRRSLRDAEELLPEAERDANMSPENADAHAAVARLRNAIAARKERAEEGQRAVDAAETAEAVAARELAAVRASIEKTVNG